MTVARRGFDPAFLNDPAAFAVNRLPAHCDHRWFATHAEAASGVSSFEVLLDGTWSYVHSDAPSHVPPGLEGGDVDLSTWGQIPVPAHVQLHGHDRPQYVNVQYPWDGHEQIRPPQAPSRYNPVSTYARDVEVTEPPQAGETVCLVVDGAESALAAWVNGTFVGYATDSFTPSEFDVTDLLRAGRNRLVLRVWKWSAASWLEGQDFFRFSGIFRSVYLRRRPPAHVQDLHVTTRVDEDLSAAVVSLDLDLTGPLAPQAQVSAHLHGAGPLTRDKAGGWSLHVSHPHLWSAEDPHLHDLVIEVRGPDGGLLEVVTQKVGIRRFAIEDGLLRVNGQRAVLKGVNRHEFGLEGRVISRERTDADLRALKALGVNALRTSHYPNQSFLYDLCDLHGLYVIDEANLETHGIWDRIANGHQDIGQALPGDQREWEPAVRDRATSMVMRDRNHPSVIMWSLGNEAYGGSVLRDVADHLRGLDERPIHYEGVHQDPRHPETTDVTSQMYTSASGVQEHLRTHRDKPFILCEFAHAMGNSFGAVERYTDLMRADELFQGVFVWDFVDQALPVRDRWGREFLGYGGDHGEAPHDADFCGNGLFFADRTPTPMVQALAHHYQWLRVEVGAEELVVHNDFAFTSSGELDCEVELAREGAPLAAAPLHTDVPPGGQARLPQPLPVPDEPGEYTVTVTHRLRNPTTWADAGQVVARDQGVVQVGPARRWAAPKKVAGGAAPVLVDGNYNIGVRGQDFEVLFSRAHGGIQSYRLGSWSAGREMLRSLPSVNFWHAPTSNERGWGAPALDGQWLLASRNASVSGGFDGFTATRLETSVRVSWTLLLPSAPASTCDLSAQVHADGTVVMDLRLHPGAGLGDPPEFGMLMALDPRLEHLRWYGEGPEETAVDRRAGALLGVHEADVRSQLTAYLKPQEAGSHTAVRWATVTDAQGVGMRFAADTPMELSALPWSPFEVANAMHHVDLPPHQRTWVRPALMRRGVGGDDSWGARPHKEFLLPAGELTFRFSFGGVVPA